jgi:hypothetical protein
MDITVANFRSSFPEFADAIKYPDSLIQFWLDVAVKLTNADRWGDLTYMGSFLFSAHNLVLERQAMNTAAVGGVPGQSSGLLSSKSVDKVAAGYDTVTGAEKDAGHWNLTIYGKRYYRLAMMFGSGPVQVGLPGPGDFLNQGAWPGVLYPPSV